MNATYNGDNWSIGTSSLLLELNGGAAVSDNIAGDAGVSLVQVLASHLLNVDSSKDLALWYFGKLSESEEEFPLLWILMNTFKG